MLCDTNSNIIEWSSEEVIIPYYNPMDDKTHRYFPDLFVKTKEKDGSIKCKLIEIKPHKQTIQPEKPTKITRKYLNEATTWVTNSCKWRAAEEYCKLRNWSFIILTENELFGKKKTKK